MNESNKGNITAFGGIIGAIVSLIIVSMSSTGSFWQVLHFAYDTYLIASLNLSGITILIASLLISLFIYLKGQKTSSNSLKTPKVLTFWFSIAPALHWISSLILFLILNRYSPKGAYLFAAIYQIILMILSYMVYTLIIVNSKKTLLGLSFYIILSFLAVLLYIVKIPHQSMHFRPIFWWTRSIIDSFVPVVVSCSILLLIIVTSGIKFQKTRNSNLSNSAEKGMKIIFKDLISNSILMIMFSLAFLTYFCTSQFDNTATEFYTHILFLVIGVIAFGCIIYKDSLNGVKKFVEYGLPIFVIETVLLLALHRNAEEDQTLIFLVLYCFMICTIAALVYIYSINKQSVANIAIIKNVE